MPAHVSSAPLVLAPREEWPEADFDFAEEEPIRASDLDSDKGEFDDDDDDDDWDVEMETGAVHGGLTIKGPLAVPAASRPALASAGSSGTITIRPPIPISDTESEEEVSTIKGIDTLRATMQSATPTPMQEEDDLEADFALPSDMTQLSLRPASLRTKSSYGSFEWGDKDQTVSSSQSSDAYTTLGFAGSAGSSPNSHHTSASLPDMETDDDSDDLEGLVIPLGLFESGNGSKQLAKLLDMRKRLPAIDERVKIASPDPDDDFEDGLLIDDDAEFGRLQLANTVARRAKYDRSRSAPSTRPTSAFRPSAGGTGSMRGMHTKSPTNPPPSSLRQLRQIAAPVAPPPPATIGSSRHYPSRTATMQMPGSAQAAFLTPKTTSLRGQKSHGNFMKPPSPPSRMSRKASLSAIANQPQASGSGTAAGTVAPVARYEAPTRASRAKSQRGGSLVAPQLEATPSLPSPTTAPTSRLTMPTSSSRLKARPSAASLFNASGYAISVPTSGARSPPPRRTTSPLPPRPPSTTSSKSRRSSVASPPPVAPVPKVMRRPKKTRTYGDGTELDGFDDLPTDRDKESRFHVQAKPGHGRVPSGGSYPLSKSPPPKARGVERADNALGPSLRRAGKIEFPSKAPAAEVTSRKKKADSAVASKHVQQKRKPTLIRNLGGAGGTKVVGEMKWNPITLRWEGNDSVLRDFDAAAAPARPALITQLTGPSLGSPVNALAAGARQVGNMIFDPAQMCWISALPEEDEPDVFADLGDDDFDLPADGPWAPSTGRLAASAPLPSAPSPSPSISGHSRARSSESGSERGSSMSMYERGSRASLVVADVDESFLEACREAEARHNLEMTGWRAPRRLDAYGEPDRTFLYDIRALATRQY